MESWQPILERWSKAGLVDPATADRIREFEGSHGQTGKLRWQVLIAVGFGCLMLGAGVLLFVSAHWDELSPASRFSLVLLMLAVFHLAASLTAERFATLATALHGVGTVALGGAIFLSAQIFNLQENWPGGVLLWALGAWIGYWFLRDWVQASFAAILTPAWLASEWIEATRRYWPFRDRMLAEGLLLLSVAYLTGFFAEKRGKIRQALAWIGGIALIPSAASAMPESWYSHSKLPAHLILLGYGLGFLLPLLLALILRRKGAWMNAVATLWVAVLAVIPGNVGNNESTLHYGVRVVGPYLWCGIACLGLIAWGVQEARTERINLGILGFGITVLSFYFSHVMDKLSRSASLMGLGLVFLVLAWALERTRRRLVSGLRGAPA